MGVAGHVQVWGEQQLAKGMGVSHTTWCPGGSMVSSAALSVLWAEGSGRGAYNTTS